MKKFLARCLPAILTASVAAQTPARARRQPTPPTQDEVMPRAATALARPDAFVFDEKGRPSPRLKTSDLATSSSEEKLRAEEVVAKHLESIGTADARAATKSVVAFGSVTATFSAPTTAQLSGRVVLASEGEKSMIGMTFENAGYSQDAIGFDGKEVTTSFVRPGVRSTLGDFLLTHGVIFKHGLLAGALSNAWPLLDFSDKRAKLEYGGTKKIGDRKAYELKYSPRGGSDLRISLFFDAETFRHVRTEYTRVIAAPMGASPEAAVGRQRESHYKMVEEFSDFKKEGELTLPHAYDILLEMDTQAGNFKAAWKVTLNQFAFNRQFKPGSFNVSAD